MRAVLREKSSSHAKKAGAPNKDAWWKDAVIYEMYVDKFAGTFRDSTERLPYLKKLGVTLIHLLPHYPSPMIDGGYDVSDYKAVRPELGTLDDFTTFVKKAHESGIRVMVDLVLNHVSTSHPWFIEASKSERNPKRNFFLWSKTGTEFAQAHNGFKSLKPSNWVYHKKSGDYHYSTFYPEQADLNWDNPEVFFEMMKVVDFWAGLGVDGFRLDASPLLIKREMSISRGLPETHAILKGIRSHIDAYNPGRVLLAEVHDTLDEVKKYFGDGDECHLVYHFPMTEQIFLSIMRGSRAGLERMIELSAGIPDSCAWTLFLRHHDEISLATLGEEVRKELLDYFDSEGKYLFETGTALRMGTMFKEDPERILEAYSTLFEIPGAHVIYYGDEIGLQNGPLEPGERDARKTLRESLDWASALIKMSNPDSLYNRIAAIVRGRNDVRSKRRLRYA